MGTCSYFIWKYFSAYPKTIWASLVNSTSIVHNIFSWIIRYNLKLSISSIHVLWSYKPPITWTEQNDWSWFRKPNQPRVNFKLFNNTCLNHKIILQYRSDITLNLIITIRIFLWHMNLVADIVSLNNVFSTTDSYI